MFTDLLFALRARGLPIGAGEWLVFLDGLQRGLASDVDALYRFGRSVLCRSEADYDAFDLAFTDTFGGAAVSPEVAAALAAWLEAAAAFNPDAPPPPELDPEKLWEEFLKRLAEQKGRHSGGNHWIGTGGTSPFGHSGRNPNGMRVGGAPRGGGGRGGAVQLAEERRWANYRDDRVLDVRDLEVALRMLRAFRRDGPVELDLDETIRKTCENAGDVELIERPARKNQVHLVLMMDAGGSMAPHAEKVERLFSAASRMRVFKSFKAYYFHNCVYDRIYTDMEQLRRVSTAQVIDGLGPRHRVFMVGDASMAPYELFQSYGWLGREGVPGVDWLRRIARRSPGSAWLNPDPEQYWQHPTVAAIGRIFPMFPLTVAGLRSAVRAVRVPRARPHVA